MAVILNALLVLVAQWSSSTLSQYLFLDYFNNTSLLPVLSMTNLIGMTLIIPFIGKITQRFGKKEGGAVGLYLSSAFCFLLLFIRPANPWIYIIIMLLNGIVLSYYMMVAYAYITDVIDHFQINTGKRKDGTIYAIYSFVRKLGQALAGGIGGWALAWIGYNQSAAIQSTDVQTKIFLVTVSIPAFCYLLGAITLHFFYPLDKEKIAANEVTIQKMEE